MSSSRKTFRIFVSSTFSDLKAERNALQQYVFPRVRDLCMQHGCRFQAIDLRWGVSEEAGRDQQTVPICLKEIERCQRVTPRPNFIILLGDRYGWRPLPSEIPADEFEAIREHLRTTRPEMLSLLDWLDDQPEDRTGWYRRDDNAVPPVYVLQPRTGRYEDRHVWADEVEHPLHNLLREVTAEIALPEDTRRKYVASATEQEVVLGALDVPEAADHVFGFLREIKSQAGRPLAEDLPPDDCAKAFVDLDAPGRLDRKAHDLQQALKNRLRTRLAGNTLEYQASWTGAGITTDHIGRLPESLEECLQLNDAPNAPTLCVDVWRRLSRVILDEIVQIEAVDPLTEEIEAHRAFGEERARHFVGREGILRTIRAYIGGDDKRPLIIHGKSGCGKTALIARANAECGMRNGEAVPSAVVVSRFIGATPGTIDIRSLLQSLCNEIHREYGKTDREVPADYAELVEAFRKALAIAEPDRPLLVFLDALDQMDAANSARMLHWLPTELPPYARVVVSVMGYEEEENVADSSMSVPGGHSCLQFAQRRFPTEALLPLPPLESEYGATLLNAWLAETGRTLQDPQQDEVISKFTQNGLPLYLKLAFEEARGWRSYRDSRTTVLKEDVSGLIDAMLEGLARPENHGTVLVSRALAYLVAARHGLTEDEILDLLAQDNGCWQEFLDRSRHDISGSGGRQRRLPVIIWSRLYHDIKPYLAERHVDHTSVLTFYHRQVMDAVTARYLNNGQGTELHRRLSDYFERQPHHLSADSDRAALNYRKLSELLYHQAEAGSWAAYEATLCDLTFVEAKCAAGMLFDLIADGSRSDEHKELAASRQLTASLRAALSALSDRPETSMQTLYNRLVWIADLVPLLRERLATACSILESRGTWIEAVAPVPGSAADLAGTLAFGIASTTQALGPNGDVVAVADYQGRLEVRDVRLGTLVESRLLESNQIVGIALQKDSLRCAQIDALGIIRIEGHRESIQGRRGERLLLYDTEHGVICVRSDHTLVSWNIERGTVTPLAESLPSPLMVLRRDSTTGRIIFVAGERDQSVGILEWAGSTPHMRTIPHEGAPIIDACLADRTLLLATLDRGLRIIDVSSGNIAAEVKYEQRQDVSLRGAPGRCVLGVAQTSGRAFVATRYGHIAAWDWRNDRIERLEDFRSQTERKQLAIFDVFPEDGKLLITWEEGGRVLSAESHQAATPEHCAEVTDCIISDTGTAVSASRQDGTIRWSAADGLVHQSTQSCRRPSALDRADADEVIVGTEVGHVFRQPPHGDLRPEDIFMAFAEPVQSLFYVGNDTVIAAGASCRTLRIDLRHDKVDVLWHGTGRQTQQKILPAGGKGVLWSLRRDQLAGGTYSVLSLILGADKENVVVTSDEFIQDFAVSPGTETICVADKSVKIFQQARAKWQVIHERKARIRFATFMEGGDLLAVILEDQPWMEVWQVAHGLPTVAAVDLPTEVSCLSTRGNRIVAGCRSGELMSLCLNAHGQSGKAAQTIEVNK